jgi:hypothetical protein
MIVLLALALAQEPNTLTDEEKKAGWRLLFDGQSSDAWRGYRKERIPPGWKAVDGVLARVSGGAGGDDIVTVEEFESFELSLEWKISPGGNAGILYHVAEQAETSWHEAPEMQVLDNARWPARDKRQLAGACYDLYAPSKDLTKPAGQWNAVKLVVDGPRVGHWMNGEKIVEYRIGSEDWTARVAASKFKGKPLFDKAVKGRICLQDHSDRGEYRSIKVRVPAAR